MKMINYIIVIAALYFLATVFSSCYPIKSSLVEKNIEEGNFFYNLPKGLLKITSTAKVLITTYTDSTQSMTVLSQSFKIVPEIVPDYSKEFSVKFKNNIFYSDDYKFKLNEKNLLTTADVLTEDRLTSVIEAVANIDLVEVNVIANLSKIPTSSTLEEFSEIFILDPVGFSNRNIYKQDWSISKINEKNEVITAIASFKIMDNSIDTVNGGDIAIDDIDNYNGLFTRPIKLHEFVITPEFQQFDERKISFFNYLPNINAIRKIPFKRNAFIKKEDKLVFENGVLKENSFKKPSELEGFATIPINIAKAAVSIPAQLFQIKINKIDKQKDLETSITALNTAIKANKKKAEEELDKLKQTQKFEAEKLELSREIELIQLRKEIEELKKKT